MNRQARLQALSEFLKKRREQLMPQTVGLPTGTRRRTPGLRREEVAQLAGVSTTWYTWLEQGRDIQVSASVLDCVASALRLTSDERKYLFSLAMESTSAPAPGIERTLEINPSLQRILQELRYCPTIVTDRRFRIVGWNEAASRVFIDFNTLLAEDRNLIRLLFERKDFRRLAVNWEHFALDFLAIFRAYYGRYVEDEWYSSFLSEMRESYPNFDSLWEQSRVSLSPDMLIEFRHAAAGKMLFQLTSLQVQGEDDLRCSVYTPAADTKTEAKLRKLVDTPSRT
ncbi:helix-turn-helix transcriptional regulator [Paenibacillus sp. OV219]|uniref:helix-turn-helix transcriptional regulator n=1 Tax=Paenibacillus sp. OV219 TaxID=1884377 RepID=UPI0008C1D806|nr:helix-turn-helix transcriptional regulator [Paenibacillus sp. OV219]SEN97727.1 Helix-turn-helix domain-containing protein [Paenibacillus sp. OV219]